MIEVHHLRAIHALAHAPTLAVAARQLRCTPSALSHLLADFERRLGVDLVERRRRPLRLTAAGRRLLAAADIALPALELAEEELRRLAQGAGGRLHLSLECHSCIDWLVPALDAYRRAHPDIDLDFRLGAGFDPLPALRDGALDLVITAEPHTEPWLAIDPLFRYEIVAVVPARSELASRSWLQPSDFAGQTVITYPVPECRLDLYTRFLEPAGVVPQRRRTAELTAIIMQWVASGLGVAALPSWAVGAQSGIATCRLGRHGLHADLRALRRDSDRGRGHLDAFVAIARRECFRTLSGIAPVPPRSAALQPSARRARR